MTFMTLAPARFLLAVCVVLILLVLSGCGKESTEPVPAPLNLESDTFRSGQYTWVDRTNPLSPVIERQYSLFRFFISANQQRTFLLRVDTTIENPARRFNDLTAQYIFTGDSLYITDSIIIKKGASNHVPFGGFVLKSNVPDSIVFQRENLLGDTVMRITFPNQ